MNTIPHSSLKNKRKTLPGFNRAFANVRRIQARINGRLFETVSLGRGLIWSPVTSGSYLRSRWIE